MAPEQSRHDATSSHKNLDQEVRELLSALTNRLAGIHRPDKSTVLTHDEDDHGVGIITLAGTNLGATMRGDMDDKSPSRPEELEDFGTYVNSNFQGINNSIMFGGSYRANDPGVHLDICDYVSEPNPRPKRGKRGKKIEKEASKSDHQTDNTS